MSLTMSPPPGGTLPLLFTWTCETCRPRVTYTDPDERLRDEVAGDHAADPVMPHTVTVGTMRGRHA